MDAVTIRFLGRTASVLPGGMASYRQIRATGSLPGSW